MSAKSAFSRIPAHLRPGISRYLVHALQPGSFLQAVVKNDLGAAVCRADQTALANLPEIVRFLHNYAPGTSFGGPLAYSEWVATPQAERVRLLKITLDDFFDELVAESGIAFGRPTDEEAA